MRFLLSKVMDDVPHARFSETGWTEPGGWPHYSACLTVSGWGPSLHQTRYVCNKDFTSEDELMEGVLDFAKDIAKDQALLARIAAKAGIRSPLARPAFGTNNPITQMRELTADDGKNIAHLHIARVLADAMVQDHGPQKAAQEIVYHIDTLLLNDQRENLGLYANGVSVNLTDNQCVFECLHLMGGPYMASLRGITLDVRAQLPETVLDASLGKPLSKLIETGIPSLDTATLLATSNYGKDGLQLIVDSDFVRIGDHPGLAQGIADIAQSSQITA